MTGTTPEPIVLMTPGPVTPRRPWGLLIFEVVQVAATVGYWVSGIPFGGNNALIYLCFGLAFTAALVALVWAIVLRRGNARGVIAFVVGLLAGFSASIYLVAGIFLLWVSAQLAA